LAGHGVRLVRELVAGNTNANPADLESLATDPEPLVRERAACNPTLAPGILDRMARDGSPLVCATVARQSTLSLSAMEILVAHPSAPVRFALARNPSLTTAVLSQLARDGDWRVCAAVAQHPILTADTIEHLLWHEKIYLSDCNWQNIKSSRWLSEASFASIRQSTRGRPSECRQSGNRASTSWLRLAGIAGMSTHDCPGRELRRCAERNASGIGMDGHRTTIG
jgi:hypothetical protein